MEEEKKITLENKRTQRERARQLLKDTKIVKEAISQGYSTYKSIAENTGITKEMVILVIRQDIDLLDEFREGRGMLGEIAADNIHSMVLDPTNKDHFAASRFVLTKYKSDLDDSLESNSEDDMGKGNASIRKKVTYGQKPKE
jgi:hypothetical protein